LLRLNDGAGFAVGVKLMRQSVSTVVADLGGRVVHSAVVELPGGLGPVSPAVVLEAVGEAVEKTIAEAGADHGRVVGVGIGLAGVIDVDEGVCRYSPVFEWRDVQMAPPLERRLGLPVMVDNDVNTLTVAEQWFGRGQGIDHFVVATVGDGIGAGVVVNGRLYRGALGAAGELGHIPIRERGPLCRCGNRGCLEALASDAAVLVSLREALDAGRASALAGQEGAGLTIRAVAEAAEAGDELSRSLLDASGRLLGLGVATLVNLFNPRLVIVTGEGMAAGEWRFAGMRKALGEHGFAGQGRDVPVVLDVLDDEAWARGAACVVLGELFTAPMHRRHGVRWPQLAEGVGA
ncbi:MAG: ROK family protein, partial [Acidimicrobiales bacterium]